MSLGKLIRTKRKELGWRQNELAKQVKVSQSLISKWENNELSLKLRDAAMLSRVLGIPLEDFARSAIGEE